MNNPNFTLTEYIIRYLLYLLLGGFLWAGPAHPVSWAQQTTSTHTVQKGETLFSIAQQYEVSIDQIKEWNNLESNQLQPGQILKVTPGKSTAEPKSTDTEPTAGEPDDTKASSSYYLVKNGDTLYEIARAHDMSVQQLKSLNNLTSDNIRVGQRLLVRQPTPTPSVAAKASGRAPQGQFTRYTVQSGQNWPDITQKFAMDSVELARLNPETTPDDIFSGKKLTVLNPPSVAYQNPYRVDAQMHLLSTISATRYQDDKQASSTSSGELYNPEALTAAHPSISLGSIIYVENVQNRRGTFVKVNDRTEQDKLKLSERAYRVLQLSAPSSRVHIYRQP